MIAFGFEKIRMGEPLFFYHHPKNLHHDVLEGLFAKILGASVGVTRLGDYAQWWKNRSLAGLGASVGGTTLSLTGAAAAADLRCRVTRDDGTETFLKLPSSTDFNSAVWKRTATASPLPSSIGRIRKFNPWIGVNRFEDFVQRSLNA